MSDILCFHLTSFSLEEIGCFFFLLRLYKIRFWNRIVAKAKKALVVLLVRLSYLTQYWTMMDQFGHSRISLLIIFSDTILHLYCQYHKKLA